MMIDPVNLQFGGGLPPPHEHPGHPFIGMHAIGQQQGGPSPPAPSPGGLPQLGDAFAEQQQVRFNNPFFNILIRKFFYRCLL